MAKALGGALARLPRTAQLGNPTLRGPKASLRPFQLEHWGCAKHQLSTIAGATATDEAAAGAAGGEAREDIRNCAIISHVDHVRLRSVMRVRGVCRDLIRSESQGKTTLVDAMLKHTKALKEAEEAQERVMDANDLERERGITILSKNTALSYKGKKINLVDTPGHADFGGEVERVLSMADSVLLLVDAAEGPMPQTRFVLQKALELKHNVIVVVNKIDRVGADPVRAVNDTFDLFCELGADDEQCDFPVVYTSAVKGKAGLDLSQLDDNLEPLFQTLLEQTQPPTVELDAPVQLYVSSTEYDDYKGRMGLGRVRKGTLKRGQRVSYCMQGDKPRSGKIAEVFVFDNFSRSPVESVGAGDICTFSGLSDVGIGETVFDPEAGEALPGLKVEDPSVAMTFLVNFSPFAGKEGKYVTSRNIKERLDKELERNIALRAEQGSSTDEFRVMGRGTLHISILVETMRREGYEFMIGPPEVLYRKDDSGATLEPYEEVRVEVPEDYQGTCIDMLGTRQGNMVDMRPAHASGHVLLTYRAPTRGLIGLRNALLTATKGTAIINTQSAGFDAWAGDMQFREQGSMVSHETGRVTAYACEQAQERGALFVEPNDYVYEGQVVGQNARPGDMKINVCKQKELTNFRAAGSDKSEGLTPKKDMSLDDCIEYIAPDELVEVTPKNIRMCKNPKAQSGKSKKGKK